MQNKKLMKDEVDKTRSVFFWSFEFWMIQDLINFSNTNQFLFLEANKESFYFFFSTKYNNNSNRKISKFSVEGKESSELWKCQ